MVPPRSKDGAAHSLDGALHGAAHSLHEAAHSIEGTRNLVSQLCAPRSIASARRSRLSLFLHSSLSRGAEKTHQNGTRRVAATFDLTKSPSFVYEKGQKLQHEQREPDTRANSTSKQAAVNCIGFHPRAAVKHQLHLQV